MSSPQPPHPHGRGQLFPSTAVPDLTQKIIHSNNQCCETGGFSDVFRCWINSDDGTKEVAVKAFRFGFTVNEDGDYCDGGKVARMVRRELGIWRRLSHPNVVPFWGIVYGFGRQGNASLVSPWMPHGTLHTFLEVHFSRLTVSHRLRLLLDIANGLQYLHSFPVVHGDLSSNNVLLDHNYNACLTDFGCASLIGEHPKGLTYLKLSTVKPGTLRWAAPEHLTSEQEGMKHTVKSDIYSFGNMAFLVLSGKYPWSELWSDAAVVLNLSLGRQPSRPLEPPIDDQYWALIEWCWWSVLERPLAEDVVSFLEQHLRTHRPPPPLRDFLGLQGLSSTSVWNDPSLGNKQLQATSLFRPSEPETLLQDDFISTTPVTPFGVEPPSSSKSEGWRFPWLPPLTPQPHKSDAPRPPDNSSQCVPVAHGQDILRRLESRSLLTSHPLRLHFPSHGTPTGRAMSLERQLDPFLLPSRLIPRVLHPAQFERPKPPESDPPTPESDAFQPLDNPSLYATASRDRDVFHRSAPPAGVPISHSSTLRFPSHGTPTRHSAALLRETDPLTVKQVHTLWGICTQLPTTGMVPMDPVKDFSKTMAAEASIGLGGGEPGGRTYCFCNANVGLGEMLRCDSDDCEREWFHLNCVGLTSVPEGSWFCDACRAKQENTTSDIDTMVPRNNFMEPTDTNRSLLLESAVNHSGMVLPGPTSGQRPITAPVFIPRIHLMPSGIQKESYSPPMPPNITSSSQPSPSASDSPTVDAHWQA